MVVSLVLAIALMAPLAATAGGPDQNVKDHKTFIDPGLLKSNDGDKGNRVDVIVSYNPSLDPDGSGQKKLGDRLKGMGVLQKDMKQFGIINGFETTVGPGQLKKLSDVPGLTVVPNAPVKLSGSATSFKSSQLWPYESGNSDMWAGDQLLYGGKLPTIAVVDSGIQNRADFGNRIVASVNLSTIAGNGSPDDQRGHGTFVAGVAAGAASDLAGAAPTAPLVSIKVMDSTGSAKTSDVINACQWILDNKDKYNIRVANFSLHSSYSTNFYRDPLDQAVEKLWFNGVTVVAAAGNYGISNTQPSGVVYSPGNDPFVITVGAVDLGNSSRANDDKAAPWSAWGYTNDGFYKPEISAPGRYMVGPVPAGSSLTVDKAANMVGTDRIELSGTSFAAPVVAGTVAQILARHPGWTPDQVKGALMKTARAVRIGNPKSAGLGELTASRAAALPGTPPNANYGLDQFLKSAVAGGSGLAFDSMSWANAAKASMSWNSMSWANQSWSDMSWADQSWASMSWADMSWNSMSWTDMSWADMSWADSSREDAAEDDSLSGSDGYVATPDQVDAAASDPDQVPVDQLPVAAPTDPTPTAATATADATAAATSDASSATAPVTALLP